MRQLKGLEIAARFKIDFKDGAWIVPSASGSGKYQVILDPNGDTCSCEDFGLRQQTCKHIYASKIVRDRDHGGKNPPFEVREDETIPKRRTYKQNWPLYNEAQTTERRRFQVLLADLCRYVPQLPNPNRGQHRAPTVDVVFAMVFKVYTMLSSRRFTCDLEDACAKGHVSTAIHYNSLCRAFEMPEMTPILRDLITRSSLPLRAVEDTFAPDSTGFSTSRFIRWYDEKYGAERSGHDWVKVHAIVGVKTNIIVAAEIHGRDTNDSPIMPSLLNTTVSSGFNVKVVSADKGYSSVDNLQAVVNIGAMPYIPFKSNATGAAGGLWEKMFLFYQLAREEFLRHYHKRSNVETAFSMVKVKFLDSVKAKTDTAITNEVLCKVLAHNVCVVHQSQVELGIEPMFWKNEQAPAVSESPPTLPFAQPG